MHRQSFGRDVCIMGGAGHVGLPLALTFADAGLRTVVYDINTKTIDSIRQGKMPFQEEDGEEMLRKELASGRLEADSSPELMSDCEFLVLIIGTPVDEHLNPSFTAIHYAIERCAEYLRDGQTLILRSTVFPGITQLIQTFLNDKGLGIHVAKCPERAIQGFSLREFRENPQIISAFNPVTMAKVCRLFSHFAPEIIEMTPMEAELTKLICNAWRYIQFATVNQFYMLATQHGLDFDRILHGVRHKYPRMANMPGPGFAAGPCLAKDTMQLAAFSQNYFMLGHSAMLVNEGLPAHIIQITKQQMNLRKMTAGILGMAFKADCDDPRDSLSYKLRKLLTLECKKVVCADPYVEDEKLVSQERVLAEADVVFVGVPHTVYRTLAVPPRTRVVDVWQCIQR